MILALVSGLGCFRDHVDGLALTSMEGTSIILDGHPKLRENSVQKCAQVAAMREYKVAFSSVL